MKQLQPRLARKFQQKPSLQPEIAPGPMPRRSVGVQAANLAMVIVPFLGLVASAVFLWGHGFHWVDLGLMLGMYAASGLGITVGYHRLFSHRAFETGRGLQFFLVVLGSMAAQGPLLKWVAIHRRHHRFSDTHDDPHSPHHQGNGIRGLLLGVWHSHVGWLFQPE